MPDVFDERGEARLPPARPARSRALDCAPPIGHAVSVTCSASPSRFRPERAAELDLLHVHFLVGCCPRLPQDRLPHREIAALLGREVGLDQPAVDAPEVAPCR